MKKIIGIIVVVLVLVLLAMALKPATRFGGTSNLDSLGLTGSLSASSTGYFGQGVIEGGLSNYNAYPASTTVNLSVTDLATTSVVAIVASSTATTVNFPASSTLTAFLPNAGDSERLIIQSASTTASTLAFVGGTGTTLQKATTTATLAAGGTAIFNLYRKANGLDFNIVLVGLGN